MVDVETQTEERQVATRALLKRPVMGVEHPRFPLVRRHADWLKETLLAETGWIVTVDAEVARLHKHPPATTDATRPATDRQGTPFTRRRYILTCLALAVLERAETQTTLGWLADQLLAETADERLGITFDLADRSERSDLVAVVRLLVDLGVITRVAGTEQSFLEESGDALYDVQRRVLGRLLAADRGPSTIAASDPAGRLAALTRPPILDAPEARNRAIRQDLGRRLLDDPVVYDDDLDEPARAYLRTQRAAVIRRLVEASGLVAEVRAEGMALLDPTGEATDVGLPEDGTEGHVTLLVAEHLATCRRQGTARVAIEAVRAHVLTLIAAHGPRWRKSARESGAEHLLTRIALTRLEQLGLVALSGDEVTIRAAVHRFSAAEPTIQGAG